MKFHLFLSVNLLLSLILLISIGCDDSDDSAQIIAIQPPSSASESSWIEQIKKKPVLDLESFGLKPPSSASFSHPSNANPPSPNSNSNSQDPNSPNPPSPNPNSSSSDPNSQNPQDPNSQNPSLTHWTQILTNQPRCSLEFPFGINHPYAQESRNSRGPSSNFDSAQWRRQWLSSSDALFTQPVYPIVHPALPHQGLQNWVQRETPNGLSWYELSENQSEQKNEDTLVFPNIQDTLPSFERGRVWTEDRCYMIQGQGYLLSESDAYLLYTQLVRHTLWYEINDQAHHRTVIGLRGTSVGFFEWHYNTPNQFNDTLVLLWKDEQGIPHVREFPVNTDTGNHNFGSDGSSSLWPNRHYPYINGWHRDYNAIQINLDRYPVRDDGNKNGHWDSDRNGWLEGSVNQNDRDRLGYAHNIHGSQVNGVLTNAEVDERSAGCQVIPGRENWFNFITQAWTGLGDDVDYYLLDARDFAPSFFTPCLNEDGSHACPHSISAFPFVHQGNTALSQEQWYDRYNCSDADESGSEEVFVVNLPAAGRLRLQVESTDNVDPDLYVLEGDGAYACRDRAHQELSLDLPQGRYVVIVDTWVNQSGQALAGPYTLYADWTPIE